MVYDGSRLFAIFDGPSINSTLVHFPFEAPFTLQSPPASAVSVPWDPKCHAGIESLIVASRGKLYYLCLVNDLVIFSCTEHAIFVNAVLIGFVSPLN